MELTIHLLLLTIGTLATVAAYHGLDLPTGPYCSRNGGNECCDHRRDSCSHRILDTLCYCDQFCNRTNFADDCCPDYEEVCLGAPPTLIRGICFLGQKKNDKCNKCICESGNSGQPEWKCETDTCMISDEVIYGVNQGGSTWRAANYTQYYTKKLKDGLVYRLGTLPLSKETRRMNPIRYDKNVDYHLNFDARDKWPRFISPIIDQGWCGSDWAVSIAGVASDRFAIQSNGAENMMLSAQCFLSCNVRGQRGCNGGHIDVGWNFARSFGMVDNDCFPYTASQTPCPLKKATTLREAGCLPLNPTRTSKYKVGPPYRLRAEKDIMYEIMESGPVQAVMTVYQDFFHYRDGIYRRTYYGDSKLEGLHSVRIVGWGEERGDKYWIVANSWGTEWGENGFFRIVRGSNESGIESFVVTVLSDVNEANLKK